MFRAGCFLLQIDSGTEWNYLEPYCHTLSMLLHMLLYISSFELEEYCCRVTEDSLACCQEHSHFHPMRRKWVWDCMCSKQWMSPLHSTLCSTLVPINDPRCNSLLWQQLFPLDCHWSGSSEKAQVLMVLTRFQCASELRCHCCCVKSCLKIYHRRG